MRDIITNSDPGSHIIHIDMRMAFFIAKPKHGIHISIKSTSFLPRKLLGRIARVMRIVIVRSPELPRRVINHLGVILNGIPLIEVLLQMR